MANDLTEIAHARELVLAAARPLAVERIPIDRAPGRFAARGIEAAEQVPGFDNSAMDGFAVRAADLGAATSGAPVRLRLVGESRAGSAAGRAVETGEAIAISTGAVVPDGTDAVVRVEDTVAGDGWVDVAVPAEPGANVRRAGEDIEPGDRLIAAGTRLGPAEVGVLASVGCAAVDCRARPRLALVATGDELISVEEQLRSGSVRNSNAHSLPALATESGAEVVSVSRAPDDAVATHRVLDDALAGCDVLVVSGGVSVGEHDHVKAALADLGIERSFWGVSLKPGKPTYFGTGERAVAFGLPGNPVSAYVTFLLFVRPALLAMQGADPNAERTAAILTEAYEKPVDRAHAIRCRLELAADGWRATPARQQGSHVMTSLLGADALALIPEATRRVEAGERVTVELLP